MTLKAGKSDIRNRLDKVGMNNRHPTLHALRSNLSGLPQVYISSQYPQHFHRHLQTFRHTKSHILTPPLAVRPYPDPSALHEIQGVASTANAPRPLFRPINYSRSFKMDSNAIDWNEPFDLDSWVHSSPSNDVQGEMFRWVFFLIADWRASDSSALLFQFLIRLKSCILRFFMTYMTCPT